MSVFVDTSAIYALVSASDASHARARRGFDLLRSRDEHLVTTNYVVLESSVLIGRRLGMPLARSFYERLLPLLAVLWVDADTHLRAAWAWLSGGRTGPSLVDWVSFETMRGERLEEAFAFDPDFAKQGFRLIA